jgi:hypothetical protein
MESLGRWVGLVKEKLSVDGNWWELLLQRERGKESAHKEIAKWSHRLTSEGGEVKSTDRGGHKREEKKNMDRTVLGKEGRK